MTPLTELPMITPSGTSRSFANPNIRQIGNQWVLSFFMPSEGNDGHEYGSLIYYVDIPKDPFEDSGK